MYESLTYNSTRLRPSYLQVPKICISSIIPFQTLPTTIIMSCSTTEPPLFPSLTHGFVFRQNLHHPISWNRIHGSLHDLPSIVFRSGTRKRGSRSPTRQNGDTAAAGAPLTVTVTSSCKWAIYLGRMGFRIRLCVRHLPRGR
jgi:hypothetical protein